MGRLRTVLAERILVLGLDLDLAEGACLEDGVEPNLRTRSQLPVQLAIINRARTICIKLVVQCCCRLRIHAEQALESAQELWPIDRTAAVLVPRGEDVTHAQPRVCDVRA